MGDTGLALTVQDAFVNDIGILAAPRSALPAGKGGGWLIGQHPEWVRLLPVTTPAELMDADTPEELEQLKSLLTEA